MRVVDFSIVAWQTRRMRSTAPVLPFSVRLTGVCGRVDLTSPSLKRNLDDAVGIFQNITNATLIIPDNDLNFNNVM